MLLAIGSGVLYGIMQDRLRADLDRRLQIRASEVRLAVWSEPSDPDWEDLLAGQVDLAPLSELDAPGLRVQTLDLTGRVLATSHNLQGVPIRLDPRLYASALEGKPAFASVTQPDGENMRVISAPITVDGKVAAILQIGQSLQPIEDVLARLRWALVLLGSCGLAAGAAGGWIVADRSLRPLSAISASAAGISAERDFNRRLNVAGSNEIGQLASVIDDLLATVEHTLRSHHDFVADISHELRNPLLAIRTNVDLLEDCPDERERHECVSEIRGQVQRMTRLVGDLLLLAQVEPRQIIEQRLVGLTPLVRRVAREAERQAPTHAIRVAQLEPMYIVGDEDRLAQLLSNLIDNAVQHTEAGATVSLSVVRADQMACLVVEDNGGGIEPQHLARIFERTYSVKPRLQARGNGLGLAIVKHLAEAHGGSVEVASEPGRGTRFTVRLPLAGPPDGSARGAKRLASPAPPRVAPAPLN